MSKKPIMFKVTRTPKALDQILSVQPSVAATYYCAVINVADSPCATFDYQLNVPSFWFPINEIGKWDYSPFFGAMRVVMQYWKGDKPILIHCHAGANRSPSVAYAILLAKGYTEEEAEQSLVYPDFKESFKRNIERGHIPINIVQFLQETEKHPEESLSYVLKRIDALFAEWSQQKHAEQKNYVITGDNNTQTRLVYDDNIKKFVIKKD